MFKIIKLQNPHIQYKRMWGILKVLEHIGQCQNTLWHNPRRTANFRTSLLFNVLKSHSYRFFKNTSNHLHTRGWALHDWFNSLFPGTPSIRFSAAAIDIANFSGLTTAAITACRMCLKARTIISWIQSDCTCDNFSESLTW